MKNSIAVALAGLAFASLGGSARAQEITARDVLQQMEGNYARLTSLELTGRIVTEIESPSGPTSGAAPRLIDAKTSPAPSGEVTTFNIRLGRPGLYRIEWSQATTSGILRKGVASSSSHGDIASLVQRLGTNAAALDMALAAATNVSGYLASTVPSMFFGRQTNEVAILNNLLLLPNETNASHECYVISGDLNGIKLVFWITKDYWLQQKKMVLGGEGRTPDISDDEIAKSQELIDQPDTAVNAARIRATLKPAISMTTRSKRTITEIYDTAEINPPLTNESFDSRQP